MTRGTLPGGGYKPKKVLKVRKERQLVTTQEESQLAYDSLTDKQKKFVDVYDGNATGAARHAGYAADDNSLYVRGSVMTREPRVMKAIHGRVEREANQLSEDCQPPELIEPDENMNLERPPVRTGNNPVANRRQREMFWTQVMRDERHHISQRLKASELLGKANGDFVIRVATPHGEKIRVGLTDSTIGTIKKQILGIG